MRTRFGLKFVAILIVVCLLGKSVMAGWLTWVGVALTILAIPASGAPPVAGGLAIAEIVCIVVDVKTTVLPTPPTPPPVAPGGPPAPPVLPPAGGGAPAGGNGIAGMMSASALSELDTALFGLHEVPQDENADAVIAVNALIAEFNGFLADSAANQSSTVLANDLVAISDALDAFADELQELGYGQTVFTSQQLQTYQADLALNGLPPMELEYLADAGLSNDFATEFHALHLAEDYSEMEDLSVVEILRQGAFKISLKA
jgi:hypothetical protein